MGAVKDFFKKLIPGKDYGAIVQQIEAEDTQPQPQAYTGSYFGLPSGNFWNYPGNGDGSKYELGLSASGSSPFLNHYFLRQNARSAYHDNPQARAIVERKVDTVVETGIRLDPIPNANILGITPEQAKKWAKNVKTRFDLWASCPKSSVTENNSFYQLQRSAMRYQERDGEYFCRLMYSARKNLMNPLQLNFIDPNQIRGNAFTSTYGYQHNKSDGIERDSKGREKAYKVWVQQPQGNYEEIKVPKFGPKSGRRMMLHGFEPEYPGQGRGYSRLGHAIQDFENLSDFSLAEIKKAVIQSSVTMFTKPSSENPASNPFDGISQQKPAGPASEINQIQVNGSTVTTEPVVRYKPIPEASLGVPGSVGVFNLEEGESLEPFKSTSPTANFADFLEAFVSHLSAASSMPIEVMLMKFGQNYSASRGALILYWRVAQIWRAEMAADFLFPVYESWLSGEIAAGRITAPGWSDPIMRAAWLNAHWIGAPMPHIDPFKEGKGKEIAARLGLADLDRLSLEHNGSDGEVNREKLKEQAPNLPVLPFDEKGGK